jgi:membrane protease YdiL (CAAX protease family)
MLHREEDMTTTTSSTVVASSTKQATAAAQSRSVLVLAYIGMLIAVSIYGFWRAFVPGDATRLALAQLSFLLALFALTRTWKPVRALRGFFLVMFAIGLLSNVAGPLVLQSALWQSVFGSANGYLSNFGGLVWKVLLALAMIGLLLMLGLKRGDFFLVKGDLNAPSKRSRLIFMRADETWLRSGRSVAVGGFIVTVGVLLVLNLPRLGGLDNLIKAIPLFPAALLFAAMNAFHEEVFLRAAPMSQLVNVVGARHSLVITTLYFGLGHYAGSVPDGVTGVVVASFLGHIMGKAMLETRGIVWPWIIHFAIDAGIFMFLAVSAMAAGAA